MVSEIKLDQDIVYDATGDGYLPMRSWRTNGQVVQMVDSKIFPMASLGVGGSFTNIGVAWITHTLKVEDYLFASYTVFDRGQYVLTYDLGVAYRSVYWNWAQENLFFIGVTDTATHLWYFPYGGQAVPFELQQVSSGHQIYLTTAGFRVFMIVDGEPRNYTLEGISLVPEITDEIQISSFPGFGGLFELPNGSLEIQSPDFNRVAPAEFTNSSVLGHSLLSPTLFDPAIGKAWIADINQIVDLPENSVDVYLLGFGSSLIRTANNTIYEMDDTNTWKQIAKYDEKYQPFDFSIIDVNLYMGTIYDNGLQFLLAGADDDNDLVPDILEGYYYSNPNTPDTDGDTIPDNVEIAFGTDPSRDDRYEDKDGDRASNIVELNSKLGDRRLDPNHADSDFGGAIDGWELKYQYNPYNNTDDLLDEDQDGVTNAIESIWDSDPFSKDTDNDGMPDGWEIQYNLRPTNPRNANFDYDNDGRTNLQEYKEGTDPWVADPPPIYDQIFLVFVIFSLLALPIVNQIWEGKLGENI